MIFRSINTCAIALVVALSTACSSSKQDSVTPSTEVSWAADGTGMTATSASGQLTGGTLGFSATYINTSSGSFSGVTFSNLPKAAGTYSLAGTNSPTATGAQAFYVTNGDTYAATSGSIIITSVGASAFSGTFSFTARVLNGTPTKTISNGKFNVSY